MEKFYFDQNEYYLNVESEEGNAQISLTRNEALLLLIIIDGKLHTHYEIIEKVYLADADAFDYYMGAVRSMVSRLNKKIIPYNIIVKSKNRVGYRLIKKVDKKDKQRKEKEEEPIYITMI
jgi:DNA-binding response OmpR family regulator